MGKRPKIKQKPKSLDKGLEILTLGSLVTLWGLSIYGMAILPETIPIHFNAAGEVDGYGDKSTIFILPILGTIIFLGMTKLNQYPHIFNYPVEITPENAAAQYANAMRMLRFMNFATVFVFMIIVLETLLITLEKINGLGNWFLPFIFALYFIPIVYFLVKSFRAKV